MILNSPYISGSLTVTGNIVASGSITLSGSVASASFATNAATASFVTLAQTASFVTTAQTASFVTTAQTASFVTTAQTASFVANAQSASNAVTAQTASFANALTVAGTLTAQTLVVQTITSSVDFVTGSTRFGSLLANTHVFSGSITMNPGGLFVSSSGFVGLNKVAPQRQYTQVANANGIVFTIQNAGATNEGLIVGFDTTGSTYLQLSNSANSAGVYLNSSGSSYIIGGSVGIGTSVISNGSQFGGVNQINRLKVQSSNYTCLEVNGSTSGGSLQFTYGTDLPNQVGGIISYNYASGTVLEMAINNLTNGALVFATSGSERARITSGGYLQLKGTSNNAIILTDSSANVIGLFATSSVIDNTPRIEVTGTTFAGTPSTAFIRANTVAFTLNSASTETMRISSAGFVGINESSPSSLLHFSRQTTWGTSTNRIININNTGTGGDINVAHNMGSITWYSGNSTPTAEIAAYRNTPASGNNIELRFYTATAGTPIESMRISSTGVITKQYQPVAIGALVSDQSISATTFTTLNYDTGTGYYARNIGSAWNNSTRTLTAPATGTYLVSVSSYTNNIGQIAMFVNGSRTISIPAGVPISSTTTWGGSCMVYLTSGDALTLRGYGDGSGTLFANGFHTWFQIRFLG